MPISRLSTSGFAFTLVELLVVISLVAVLLSMLLPTLSNTREKMRQLRCATTLSQMGVANGSYAADNKGFNVHGVESLGAAVSGYGRKYYASPVFDDDWYSTDKTHPQPPGDNRANGGTGEQNICNVGQLMWDFYLPEKAENVACVQTDFYEPGLAAVTDFTRMSKYTYPYAWIDTVKGRLNNNWAWRTDIYQAAPSYHGPRTTYVVRGPLSKNDSLPSAPARRALWVDNEAVASALMPINPGIANNTPVPYWGRVHDDGVNVAYHDGHVALFRDPQRVLIYNFKTPSTGNYDAKTGGVTSIFSGGGLDL